MRGTCPYCGRIVSGRTPAELSADLLDHPGCTPPPVSARVRPRQAGKASEAQEALKAAERALRGSGNGR